MGAIFLQVHPLGKKRSRKSENDRTSIVGTNALIAVPELAVLKRLLNQLTLGE
jgi:hypothetical protein